MKQQLTKEQRELIEQNYSTILDKIKNILKTKSFRKILSQGGCSNKAAEIISFLPDVTLEFKTDLMHKDKFQNFAAYRCIYRYIDSYRKNSNYVNKKFDKIQKIMEIEDKMLQDLGFIDEKDLIKQFEQNEIAESYFHNRGRIRLFNKFHTLEDKRNNSYSRVEEEDQIQFLLLKADEFFADSSASKLLDKIKRIKKKFVKEHLIPRIQGKDYCSLDAITEAFGITKQRLYGIISDDTIKGFIADAYRDKDYTGRPIVK